MREVGTMIRAVGATFVIIAVAWLAMYIWQRFATERTLRELREVPAPRPFLEPWEEPRVRLGPYDHEALGDFNEPFVHSFEGVDKFFGQPWTFDHDPTLDYDRCEACNAALRRAFNKLADHELGPRDADVLMETIRRVLGENVVAIHEERQP
jgi:hypothetical protein